jgi:hypothetical protein
VVLNIGIKHISKLGNMRSIFSDVRSFAAWMGAMSVCAGVARAQFDIPVLERVDIYRGQRYTQTASGVAAAASNPYSFQIVAQPISQGWITSASVTVPAGGKYTLSNLSGGAMGYKADGASASAFDAAYGSGNYTVSYHYSVSGFYSGDGSVSITVGASAYPAAPQLVNFTEAQSLDVTKDFTFTWQPFSTSGADDFIQFQILDGTVVVYDSGFGFNANLAASSNSDTVYADTLTTGKTYTGRLVFYKITNGNLYSETPACGGYSAETTFAIKAGGSGTVDTTAPTLASSIPANNATDVSTSGFNPITFTFSEPMAETQSIQWSSNLSSDGFTYIWSSDKTSLTCFYAAGLPSTATITWTLNPTASNAENFRDLAGNPLSINTYTGKFTTMKGATNNPCSDTNSVGDAASVMISKTYYYIQTNTAAPVFNPAEGTFFYAAVHGPSTLTSASVTVPSSPAVVHPLEVYTLFGETTGYYTDEMTNLTTFDATYPSGNYQVNAIAGGASYSATLSLAVSGKPTVPHIANYTAAQTVDADAAFTLQWDAYPSAGTDDAISLSIADASGSVFHAPDKCIPIDLPATATSIVIPKGTFKPGISYTGTLDFFHMTSSGITMFPGGQPGMTALNRTTKFLLTTTGGVSLPAPVISNVKVLNKTQIQFQVACTAGHSLVIRSTPDFKTFTPAFTTNVTTSPVTVTIPLGTDGRMFYQAVQ